jgi:hypothetical protein
MSESKGKDLLKSDTLDDNASELINEEYGRLAHNRHRMKRRLEQQGELPLSEADKSEWTKYIKELKSSVGFYTDHENLNKPMWIVDEEYTVSEIEDARNFIAQLLKETGNLDLLGNNPDIVRALHQRKLNYNRNETISHAKDTKNMPMIPSNETEIVWSKDAIRQWKTFMGKINDSTYIQSYKDMLKEQPTNNTRTISKGNLSTISFKDWTADEAKRMCWLETVKILKICDAEEFITSRPDIVEHIYIDRLTYSGFADTTIEYRKENENRKEKEDDIRRF